MNAKDLEQPHIPNADDVAFVAGLCLEVTEVRGVLAQHLRENLGQVLPYMLLWDITDWLVARVAEQGQDDPASRAILAFCESRFGQVSAGVDNLIGVGLLENIMFGIEGPEQKIVPMLGPRLRADLEMMMAGEPARSS